MAGTDAGIMAWGVRHICKSQYNMHTVQQQLRMVNDWQQERRSMLFCDAFVIQAAAPDHKHRLWSKSNN